MKWNQVFFFILILFGISFNGFNDTRKVIALEGEDNEAFERVECWFDSPIPLLAGPDLECGYVSVPERHDHPEGREIRLPIAILKAATNSPYADPLFMAQGGPGGDAFEIFPILVGQYAEQLNRDIVIFNQRGTRYAEPSLLCTEGFDAAAEILALTSDEADARSLTALSACYMRLNEEGIDLSAYNSLENAADIDAIRLALGYDEYNFYGVSYGTLLGLHLMRNQPQGLRSVILDGVVPPNLNFIPQIAANTDRVFTKIIEACREDEKCAAEYPNLEERFFDLIRSMNESPQSISIKDPETGKSVKAYLDGDVLVDVLFQAFYLPDFYATFPKLVANLEKGDLTFIRSIWPLFAFDRTLSEGMYFSVICAEDADFGPFEANVDGIRPYFAEGASGELQSYLDACDIWQVDQLPSSVDDAVSSEVPTLLLSGYYDPVTPPEFADIAAKSLANAYIFVEPTGSHGVAFDNSCTSDILRQFLENPAQSPDMSCRSEITPTLFVESDALSFPFLGEINQLSQSMWTQLGLATFFLIGVLSSFLILPLVWLIGILGKQDPLERDGKSKARRLKWVGGALILLFGLLALVFISGTAFFTIQSVFNGMAGIFAISGAAAPFFTIPLILVVLAVILIFVSLLAWRRRAWSIWMRIYYSFLAFCALGYAVVLAYGGMMTILL
jgi:pimeloyl-ACP methyl ester carboxylesterase